MVQVSEIKYLGFVLSESASNVPNIVEEQKRGNGTRRNIMNMIKYLQTYTIQNGIIYLNSLLRSSLLYAGETYYNLTVRNLRLIEKIEEYCLHKILETKKTCLMSILHLETGQLSARFQINIMKLNFLKYILHQNKNTLVYKFFKAYYECPTKGDWVSSVKKLMSDNELDLTFDDIVMTKNIHLRKLVKKKVKKYVIKN